jgi:peptidoglycan/LPS O-acetylase OafA/YrhL
MALFFAWLIWHSVEGRGRDWQALLRMRWLTYLGTISYTVYVLHMFAPVVWLRLAKHVPAVAIPAPYAHVALSVLAGALSWHLLEKPLGRLKRWFPYVPTPRREDKPAAPGLARAA